MPKSKVWAVIPGAVVKIDFYGTATNDLPCVVPAVVGEELSKVEGLRVEPDGPAPAPHEATIVLDGEVVGRWLKNRAVKSEKE